MSKKGPKKPAREMTTQEAAERLLGKRVIRKVHKELEDPEPAEKPKKSRKKSATKG